MGDLKADVSSRAWSAGLRGEYVWNTPALDIIPHAGVRYTGLTVDGYDVRNGGTVFEVEQDFQGIWTFPVGVTLRKDWECASGWVVRPQIDLGVIPAAGDVKAESRVRIPGVTGSSNLTTQVVDYLTFDGTAGLEMKKDNVAFGLNYNLQASEHRTGHGVFGTFRYEF